VRTSIRSNIVSKKDAEQTEHVLAGGVAVSLRINHAEENFYRGESWQSPDTVPMTDEQMKEMKLERQPEKAISVGELSPFSFPTFPVVC
jgi:hypothetical protein